MNPVCFIFLVGLVIVSSKNANDMCDISNKFKPAVANVDENQLFFLHHINNGSPIKYTLPTAASLIPNSPNLDKTKPMIIIIHGYIPIFGNNNTEMIQALKSVNQVNIFDFDYSAYTKFSIPQARADSFKVGELLGSSLAAMKDRGVVGFHLIGHSLGDHVSGFAGKEFKRLTSTKLDRITALDPGGVCFTNKPANERLDSADAEFVDVIHTDAQIGMPQALGHVDFYPNGGDNMPGIFNIDHLMSIQYFIESITNDNFMSVACTDWNTFKTGACSGNPIVNMGYWTPTTTRGHRYLRTRDSSLYSMGTAGLS